jgi:chromosome segregation ATPase
VLCTATARYAVVVNVNRWLAQGIALRAGSASAIKVRDGPTDEESKSATVISSAMRGHIARKRVAAVRQEREVQQREQRQRELAATKIGAVARGRSQRKKVEQMKGAQRQRQREAEAERAQREARLEHEMRLRDAAASGAAAAFAEDVQKARQLIATLRDEVADRDQQISRLKGDMTNAASTMKRKDDMVAELQRRITELETAFEQREEGMKFLMDDVAAGKAREDALARKLQSLTRPETKVRRRDAASIGVVTGRARVRDCARVCARVVCRR